MDEYYCVEEFSDNEVIDSSSDDEDFKSLFTFEDSEEDFETEMERERQSHTNGVHKQVITSNENQSNTEEEDSCVTKNDELLYDPKSDENDEKWADSQRCSAIPSGANTRTKATNSDATLNCPACMALLCMDCQRHDVYRTQYRAMFVRNCRIDFTQKFHFKDKQKKRKRNERSEEVRDVDIYYTVLCDQCNTQVGVYDQQEVYHFFGVLASF